MYNKKEIFMLNYLWVFMILAGVVYGICTGRVEAVSDAFLTGGGEAVSICITMLGIITLWTGMMNIVMKSGLIDAFQRKITPIINWLFPQVPKDHAARKYIAINFRDFPMEYTKSTMFNKYNVIDFVKKMLEEIRHSFNEDMLFVPEINIRFGCYYLKYLLTMFNGNINNFE